jgi:hypothetical protein
MDKNELRALRALQLESIQALKRKLAFWDKIVHHVQCKRDRVYRQHSLTVRAYQQTDLSLAQLDGRLAEAKPKTTVRKPRAARPDAGLKPEIIAMLRGHGLTPEQQAGILASLGY